jgi:agmatinase
MPRSPIPSDAAVGLLGVPFDANSSFRRGPARAPAAIRAALGSEAGNPWSETGVRVWPSERVHDHGDLDVPALAGSREPVDRIEVGVRAALARTPTLVVLGGDHAVTYPVLRAVVERHGQVDVLHVDAHPDLYPDYEGNRYSHACPFARSLEDGLIDRLVQVGIRTYTPEQAELARRYGVRTIAPEALLRPPALAFRRPLYVSIDLDGLDPAYAPGVSHPEPGGISVRDVLSLLARVRAPALVGGDVVELNPECDPAGLTAGVAAKLARELLARLLQAGPASAPGRRARPRRTAASR